MCSVAQSCLILCDPVNCSPPGSSVLRMFQARILIRLPFPSSGDLPNPGIEPTSLMSPVLARGLYHYHPQVDVPRFIESACDEGDRDSIPGSGRSPGEGNGNLLQYSCLENPMDRGA